MHRRAVCDAVTQRRNTVARARFELRLVDDYHYRLREMLQRIATAIDEAAGGAVSAIACDTKPLAERALAARSGLGWIGKHTNLISPDLGSFVFLGEVITSVHLPPDEPSRKQCGACVRCVTACPTGALRGDYTMDASRCIADLTQRTDGIPIALRPLVGDWVWGCDLCQTACPPTQRAGTRRDARWTARSTGSARPPLLEMLAMRSATFKRRFRSTAMGWRGAAVLRRNAAVAIGNALDRSAVAALSRSLAGDPHPMVRGHAAWALGRIGSPAAEAALRQRRRTRSRPGRLPGNRNGVTFSAMRCRIAMLVALALSLGWARPSYRLKRPPRADGVA